MTFTGTLSTVKLIISFPLYVPHMLAALTIPAANTIIKTVINNNYFFIFYIPLLFFAVREYYTKKDGDLDVNPAN